MNISSQRAKYAVQIIYAETSGTNTSQKFLTNVNNILYSFKDGNESETNPAISLRKSLSNAVRSEETIASTRKTFLHQTKEEKSSLNDLASLGFKNSNFDRKHVDYQLSRLFQIHLTLEHLMLIHVNLNLVNGKFGRVV